MANIVDYQNLEKARIETGKKFDEMIENLTSMKNQIDSMNAESWKGSSANVFNEVFEEIKTKLNTERENFDKEMENKMNNWYNSFEAEEKAQIQAAKQM